MTLFQADQARDIDRLIDYFDEHRSPEQIDPCGDMALDLLIDSRSFPAPNPKVSTVSGGERQCITRS